MHDTAIDALRERVKGLSGPDREVDKEIATVVLGIEWRPYRPRARKHWGYWPDGRTAFFGDVPQYTHSIDAALALGERKLPGAWWIMAKGRVRAGEPLYAIQLFQEGHNPFTSRPLAEAEHEQLCAAIILALLSALKETAHVDSP